MSEQAIAQSAEESRLDIGAEQSPQPQSDAVSASSNPVPPQADAAPTPSAEFKIPDEYKDKGWVQKIKAPEDLWKQLDNAQSLLGKKQIVPDFEKASEKEIEDYFSQIRPKDKSEYQFNEDLTDDKKALFSDMLYEAGLSKFQANKLIAKYTDAEKAVMSEMYSKDKFIDSLKNSFGEGYEKTAGDVTKSLKQVAQKDDLAIIDNAPNEILSAFYRTFNNFMQQYGANVDSIAANKNNGSMQTDVKAIQAQIRQELVDLQNKPHTQEDKKALLDKLTATYKS